MSFERFTVGAFDWSAPVEAAEPAPPGADPHAETIREVRTQIDRLEQRRRHHRFGKLDWYVLLKDLRTFTDDWLDIALGCGWPLLDLYGTPPNPGGRVGLMGVTLLLGGRPVESIDENEITIGNLLGPPNVWRRAYNGTRAPHGMAGSVLVWRIL